MHGNTITPLPVKPKTFDADQAIELVDVAASNADDVTVDALCKLLAGIISDPEAAVHVASFALRRAFTYHEDFEVGFREFVKRLEGDDEAQESAN